MKDHLESPQIGAIALRFAYNLTPATEKLLRAIIEKNPHAQAQGLACFGLATALKNQATNAQGPQAAKASKEAEELYKRVVEKYADIQSGRATLGQAAQAELTGLRNQRNLVVGKVAPEIEGEDIDGQKFKLSDYRGKVVVLDFWGHW
jgi:hypothetical protein